MAHDGGRGRRREALVSGVIQMTARGFGYFQPDDGSADWFLPADAMHGAMHGDRVLVRYAGNGRNGPEGEVARVETRAWSQVVGTMAGGYVVADDRHIPRLLVSEKGDDRARDGNRVVAVIERYPDGEHPMSGRIVERLGRRGEPGVDVLAAVRRFGVRDVFPGAVLEQAETLPQSVTAEAAAGRIDLRDVFTVTIDGPHSKDFDDAVSFEALGGGGMRLGVHIADVAAYVRSGSVIDREARLRGTSVYFVDRVIPMLPEALSNGICSLNEGEDRLTLSCLMELDTGGNVVSARIAETVIRSRHRLVYGDVSALIGGDPALRERYADAVPTLLNLARLQKLLYARRCARGSIDFEIAESAIEVDAQGRAVGLAPAERGVADRIIEECMLLANEAVARFLRERGLPGLFRVHEPPSGDRLRELNAFLQTLGYGFSVAEGAQPRTLRRVTERASGRPEERVISRLLLRAMQRARYDERPLGHYGLALSDYCHFTSPIRRYPDLMVHRILKWHLHGQLTPARRARLHASLPALAVETSDAERRAMEAERAVEDVKRCEYMQGQLGETFDGVISGVTGGGFYVELDNTAEGVVSLRTLTDDWYRPELRQYRIVGERSGRVLRLGDRVRVQVARVDADTATIDLLLKPGYNTKRIYNPARKEGRRHGGQTRRKGARAKQKGKA